MRNSKFIKGNVIKTYKGSIEIVIKVHDDGYTNTIPIDATNCEIGHRADTYEDIEQCSCELWRGKDDHDEDCQRIIYGMDKAKLVAPTVKDWIIKSSTKKFGF